MWIILIIIRSNCMKKSFCKWESSLGKNTGGFLKKVWIKERGIIKIINKKKVKKMREREKKKRKDE